MTDYRPVNYRGQLSAKFPIRPSLGRYINWYSTEASPTLTWHLPDTWPRLEWELGNISTNMSTDMPTDMSVNSPYKTQDPVALGIELCTLGSYCLALTQANHSSAVSAICPNAQLPMINCESNLYWIRHIQLYVYTSGMLVIDHNQSLVVNVKVTQKSIIMEHLSSIIILLYVPTIGNQQGKPGPVKQGQSFKRPLWLFGQSASGKCE